MKYEYLWRNKSICTEAKSLEDMAKSLREAADFFQELVDTGKVELEDDGGVEDDYANLVTDDDEVAAKYGFDKLPPELADDYEED